MHHKKNVSLSIAILTISDTRTSKTDTSGNLLENELIKHGHSIATRSWVKDDVEEIKRTIESLKVTNPFAIITTGGTGIAKRDLTYEALSSYIDQKIPGFGELFRMLSYEEVGSRAMVSRAFAGFHKDGILFFCLPGSIHACRTAMEKLILPELPHLFFERTK